MGGRVAKHYILEFGARIVGDPRNGKKLSSLIFSVKRGIFEGIWQIYSTNRQRSPPILNCNVVESYHAHFSVELRCNV